MAGIWKILVLLGITLLLLGGVFFFADKLGLSSFKGLPGDIVVRKGNTTFAFPIVTCIVVSVAVTLLLRLFR